eukprot:g50135.t1
MSSKLDLDGLEDSAKPDVPDVPTFKKKKRKRENVRSAQTEVDFVNDVVALETAKEQLNEARSALDQAKWVQKHRKRHAGINPEEADQMFGQEEGAEEEEEEEAAPAQVTTAAEKGIQEGFKKEVNQQSILDAQKDAFISAKMDEMKKKSGGNKGQALIQDKPQEESRISEIRRKEAQLYKDKSIDLLKDHRNPFVDGEEESGDRWLAGIAEVSLPISYKIKNIEATEKAKQELFMKPLQKTGTGPSAAPVDISKDFRTHRREWAEQKREERMQGRIARAVKEGEQVPQDTVRDLDRLREHKERRDLQVEHISEGGAVPRNKMQEAGEEGVRRVQPHAAARAKRATDDTIMDRFLRRYKWNRISKYRELCRLLPGVGTCEVIVIEGVNEGAITVEDDVMIKGRTKEHYEQEQQLYW